MPVRGQAAVCVACANVAEGLGPRTLLRTVPPLSRLGMGWSQGIRKPTLLVEPVRFQGPIEKKHQETQQRPTTCLGYCVY